MAIGGQFPATVYYAKKDCGGFWQIRIDSIVSQVQYDMIKTHNSILFEIIRTNAMQIPPLNENDGEVEWRIIRRTCWKYRELSNGSIQVPCDPEECCVTRVKIKKKENCDYIFTILSQKGSTIFCPDFGTGPDSLQSCINTCIPIEPPSEDE